MSIHHLTNHEIAINLAAAIKSWRISPNGAGMTQTALAEQSGIGLTPFKRFEKTGAITLRNLIAILRAMDLLDGLSTLIPDPETSSPLEVLAEEKKRAKLRRKRAPRAKKSVSTPEDFDITKWIKL